MSVTWYSVPMAGGLMYDRKTRQEEVYRYLPFLSLHYKLRRVGRALGCPTLPVSAVAEMMCCSASMLRCLPDTRP